MNIDLALSTRKDLRVIITSYEAFLRSQVLVGQDRAKALEAFTTRDVMRTLAMSEVSKTRVDKVLTSKRNGINPEALAEGGSPILVDASTPVDNKKKKSDLFKNLEDCIPCNFKWESQDFDWDRLKEILTADLKARYSFLLNLEDFFKGNPILDDLCRILKMFRDICPDELLVLVGVLTAYILRILDSIEFNLSSAVGDILGTLLRPYIGGLEDFLGMYFQFLVDQIDCILNSIETSARGLQRLEVSNTRGPDSIKFKKELTGEEADGVLEDIAVNAARGRALVRESFSPPVVPDDISVFLRTISNDVVTWVESNLNKVQDALIDLLGGEWLMTKENLSWYEQVKAVSTLINIIEVIVKLGTQKELCTEDNVRSIIEGLNVRLPNGDTITIDSSSPSSNGNRALQEPPSGNPSDSGVPTRKQVLFALTECLKATTPTQQAQLRQWRGELA